MVVIALIFIVGLTPAVISAVMTVRADRREKQPTLASPGNSGIQAMLDRDRDLQYIEGVGYLIGDITCELNARSPYLRCAVNPMGPCDGCKTYAPKVFERQY